MKPGYHLKTHNINFEQLENGVILLREAGKPRVDFYPTTGTWNIAGQSKTTGNGNGEGALVKWYLKQSAKAKPNKSTPATETRREHANRIDELIERVLSDVLEIKQLREEESEPSS